MRDRVSKTLSTFSVFIVVAWTIYYLSCSSISDSGRGADWRLDDSTHTAGSSLGWESYRQRGHWFPFLWPDQRTAQVIPPRSCSVCASAPEVCEEVGASTVAKAIAYAGSNDRLRRALAKMRSGEPFTVGVIGGSVSGGHGIQPLKHDPLHDPQNMHRIIFDHLDSLFPTPNGVQTGSSGREQGKNSLINGAVGGTGSGYFSLCYGEHIPEDVDLVIIELSINDEVLIRNTDSFELLVRVLMELPRQPAIINLNVFALMFAQILNGGDLHSGIAQYYDIPTISFRNAYLHEALANVDAIREIFTVKSRVAEDDLSDVDLRHISPKSHRLLANFTNAYIDSQLCEMDLLEAPYEEVNIDTFYPIPPLPRLRLTDKYDQHKVVPKLEPNCFSMNTAKNKLVPYSSEGWREWNWEKKNYLVADEPGAKVSFAFSTKLGTVELHYLRSAIFGLGTIKCWVDDDEDQVNIIEGYWNLEYNIARMNTIRSDLEPGEHLLHCEVLEATADPNGGHEFRIISLTRQVPLEAYYL